MFFCPSFTRSVRFLQADELITRFQRVEQTAMCYCRDKLHAHSIVWKLIGASCSNSQCFDTREFVVTSVELAELVDLSFTNSEAPNPPCLQTTLLGVHHAQPKILRQCWRLCECGTQKSMRAEPRTARTARTAPSGTYVRGLNTRSLLPMGVALLPSNMTSSRSMVWR